MCNYEQNDVGEIVQILIGGVAQLAVRLLCKQMVEDSSSFSSTGQCLSMLRDSNLKAGAQHEPR